MKIKIFGKDAIELEKYDNPQLERMSIVNVDGRCVVWLEIKDYPIDRYCSKAEVVKV